MARLGPGLGLVAGVWCRLGPGLGSGVLGWGQGYVWWLG